jgi:hypothetical protein
LLFDWIVSSSQDLELIWRQTCELTFSGMNCSIKGLLHCWWTTDPDFLDLVNFELLKLVADELFVPSAWVLALLRDSCEKVKVLLASSVAVVG